MGSNFWIDKVQMRKLISYCYFVEGRSIDEVPPWLFILWTFLQLINQALWPLLTPEYPSPSISSQGDTRRINKQVNFTRPSSKVDNYINSSLYHILYCKIYRWSKTMIWNRIDHFFFFFLLKIRIIKNKI